MEKSIFDPNFKYTPSSKTDISKTFARIKRELNRPKGQDLIKPLVTPSLNPGGFVLSAEWLEMD